MNRKIVEVIMGRFSSLDRVKKIKRGFYDASYTYILTTKHTSINPPLWYGAMTAKHNLPTTTYICMYVLRTYVPTLYTAPYVHMYVCTYTQRTPIL